MRPVIQHEVEAAEETCHVNCSYGACMRNRCTKFFGMMEAVYLGYKDGSIAKEVFDGRMKGFKLAMSRNRILSDYWPHWRQFDLTDSFVAYVDKEIVGKDA